MILQIIFHVATFHQTQSEIDYLRTQLRDSEKSKNLLNKKIQREKKKYSDLLYQCEKLKAMNEVSQVATDKPQQEEDYKVEKIQTSPFSELFDEDTMTELTKLQLIMEDVSASLDKVKVIRSYWSGEVSVS